MDAAPELRMQSLAVGLNQVHAVLITHTHADHIFGLDDIRRFNDLIGEEIPVYGDEGALADIQRIFRYVFIETPPAGGKPQLNLRPLTFKFELFGMDIHSFTVMHGSLPIQAFRFNRFAYVTDVSEIPPDSMKQLKGLDLLILDAVRPDPHPTHFGLYQALDVIAMLAPKRALLTHLSHHFDHDATNAALPPGVELAYDGQIIDLE